MIIKNPIVKCSLWMILMLLFPVASGIIVTIYKADAIGIYLVQGSFMVMSLIFPILFIMREKIRLYEFGIRTVKINTNKKVIYYIPLLLSIIPLLIKGIDCISPKYIVSLIFFTMFVAIAEESYFRGVIMRILSRTFSIRKAILISSFLFGIAHSVCIINGSSIIMVVLQVLNAFIFGIIVAQLYVITESIIPGMVYHMLFNFVNHVSKTDGLTLLIICCIQEFIMLFYIFWLDRKLEKIDG